MPRVDDSYLQSRRRQILDAALRCFSREGFHRTTMADIVAETELSAGAIYRYFPAKEDIVAAIATEHHDREAAALAQASSGGDVREDLHRLVDASLGRLVDPDEQQWRRITVQIWGEALREARIMEIVRGGLEVPLRTIAGLLRDGQGAGTVRPEIDPDATARVCVAIFQGLVLQQAWDPDTDLDAYIDAVRILTDSLIPSAPPPTAAD